MTIVTTTPSVVQAIVETSEEKEFWTVVREHERPPYHFAEEGVNNRLNLAARLVYEEHVHPQSDGSFQVDGSGGRRYRVADACSCPASQKSKSKWCKHMVAVALYVEWQRRLRPVAPVVLGTLRAETAPLPQPDDDALGNGYPVDDETLPLPIGPVSVDERLAPPPTVPQEALMTADPDADIPEPDEAPMRVLEPQTVTTRRPGGRPTTLPLQPQDDDLERALQVWTTQRQVVQRFLKQELHANIDYYTLRIGGKESKPSLSKAGAEKVLGWLRWSASFSPDTGTWEMLGRPQDLVCYICTLRTRSGEILGEGRGARSLKKDGGDVNKAIKMAEKSSMVSAVLRTGCLSDVFTQDLDEMQEPEPVAPTRATPSAQELRARIWALVQQRAPQVTTREDVERYVQRATGYPLHPDQYAEIVRALEQQP